MNTNQIKQFIMSSVMKWHLLAKQDQGWYSDAVQIDYGKYVLLQFNNTHIKILRYNCLLDSWSILSTLPVKHVTRFNHEHCSLALVGFLYIYNAKMDELYSIDINNGHITRLFVNGVRNKFSQRLLCAARILNLNNCLHMVKCINNKLVLYKWDSPGRRFKNKIILHNKMHLGDFSVHAYKKRVYVIGGILFQDNQKVASNCIYTMHIQNDELISFTKLKVFPIQTPMNPLITYHTVITVIPYERYIFVLKSSSYKYGQKTSLSKIDLLRDKTDIVYSRLPSYPTCIESSIIMNTDAINLLLVYGYIRQNISCPFPNGGLVEFIAKYHTYTCQLYVLHSCGEHRTLSLGNIIGD